MFLEPFILYAVGFGGSGVSSSESCLFPVAETVFFTIFGVQSILILLVMHFGVSTDVENFYILSEFKVRCAISC